MKSLKYLLGIIFITGFLNSCTDDDYTQLDDNLTQIAEITSSQNGQSYVLLNENADMEALNLTWSEAVFNVNVQPYSYIVEMALGGTDFANPYQVANTSETALSLTVARLNSIAVNELGILPDTTADIDIRIATRIGTQATGNRYSQPITINVTTYTDVLDLSTPWGVVGSATPNGWDGPDVPFWKQQGAENAGILVAYANLTDGEIKFRENNDWANNYGGSGGTLVAGGDNIPVTAGSYKITINLNDLTYTIEPFSLGIVGDATPNGWGGPDVQLLFDPTSDQFRTVVQLTTGELKFRMNNAWDVNWGDDGMDGTLDPGGANIAVTAGKYVVTVNMNDMTYEIVQIENIWGLVGSATPNGWDGPDVQMNIDYTSDFETNQGASAIWVLKRVNLMAGEVKFRANNDWGLNFGGSGLSGNLEAGGGNIVIDSAGNYDVEMDLSTMTYLITPSE